MTTANVQIKKILVGRGNATISSNYAGVRGEVTMNTTTKALHVHDGVTTGGWPLATEFYVANLIASAGGVPGPQGPQGNIGAQGPQGIQGNVGPQGIQGNVGPQGIQGNTGAQGAQGIQGNVGATGATGPQGIQGNVGATGSQGPQGIQGNTGATGAQGIQGNVGATGSQGPQGSPGIQGNVGAQGIQGNVGATGSQGIQGNIGPQGPQGIQGQQGNTGAQGVSVTLVGNVATSGNLPPTGNAGDGYIVTTTGNLFFWNSNLSVWADIGPIVGPQGDAGPQGIQGNTGAQGSQGIQGNIGPQGPQGIQGNIGPQGPQGEQGIQGNIGPQGPQGIQGNVGATGSQGPQGIQGNVGATGPQGIQGNVGATGPQGPQGIQGNTGAQGSQGIQGNIGPQGIQGNVGAQGIQGNIGPQGPVGPAGSAANTGDFTFTHSNLASSTNANIRITTNGNAFVLGSNGNLFLPNNMSFVSSPAMATTGIVFGDGSYQNTAYTGAPVSQLINGVHTVILDSTGNLTVPSSILPTADNTQDLGSATQRFRHLYVGPGTVYIGNAAIKSTLTGNLILPGITRAVANTAYAEEVYEEDDQEYSFATVPTVIDNARYSDLSGRVNGLSFTPAEYSVDQLDDDGYISGITITSPGSGYSDQVDDLADQDMWATEVANPFASFVANDWIQIPFRVNSRAGESEYDFSTGGGSSDRLVNESYEVVLDSAGHINLPGGSIRQAADEDLVIRVKDADDDGYRLDLIVVDDNDDTLTRVEVHRDGVEILTNFVSGDAHGWYFRDDGNLQLPAGGDIVDSTGASVLGGGGGNVSLPGLATSGSGTSNVAGNQVYALSINTESESDDEIAFKVYAGGDNAGPAIAIGQDIGGSHRANVIAIGNYDVGYNSLPGGVYIGYGAGYNSQEQPQGLHSIAIGSKAAWDFATNNSITINATGDELNPDESGLFIKPIRAEEYDDVILYYNPDSGEVTYANNTGTGALVTVGNTASGTEGSLWYNTDDGRTYVYALDTWIDASPAVVPGNMVGYDLDGNITLRDDASINYANGVSIINSVYGDSQVANFLSAYTGNIAKIGATPLSIAAASVRLTSDNETWTFAPDGDITLPNGMTIESNGALGVNATVTIGGDDTRISIYNDGAPPGLYITANATGTAQQWVFGPDGDLAFPDGSTQTTAYTGGAGGTGNALVNGGYTVALQANGVVTIGANATISNDGAEFRLWATDTDITVYRNGQDGYGVKSGNIEVYTDNGLRTLTNSNGFELKTGNIIIPNDKGVVFANGVNILSTVDVYGNTQVASYLLNFDGDIEFTSSTARIGNVDVITVMDSVQSPVYRFVNGGKITGIGNNLNIQTTTGVPSGPVTKISDNQGWDENNVGTDLPTTGGTGSGLTVDVVDGGSFYSIITINNPGSGYTNGDVLTVTRPSISEIFSISVPIYDWNFGNTGSTTFPGNLTIQSNPFNPGTVISQANALMTVVTTGNAATYIGWGEFGNGEPGNIALVAFNDDAGAVAIQTGATTGPEAFNEWIFDADGTLTFPIGGNLIFDSSATSVIDGVTSITANGNVTAAQYNFANGVNIFDTITGVTSINTSVSTLTVSDASGDYTYGALNYSYAVNGASNSFDIQYSAPLAFGNVDINVGNVTAIGTANVANLIISGTAPGTLLGSTGDTVGMVRVDSNYIYYCTSTFVPASWTVGWDGSVGNTLFLAQGAYPTPQVGWTVTQNIYTFTIDTVTDDGYGHWQITWTGTAYGSPNGGTATLTNPNPATIWRTVPLNIVANTYVALGTGAGGATQSQTAVAIGVNAGNVSQDYYTVAIGIGAGRDTQLAGAIAIGAEAGGNSQGTYGIAIGFRAGRTNQASNTIILNATGANLNATTANTLTVAPIRNTTGTDGLLQYNNTTKEVSYSSILGGNLTVTGNITQQSAYYETYSNVTNSGGNLTCNFVNGSTFYATLTANVTVNFTNVVATAGRVTGATLIVDQGATPYSVANLQINGGGIQTIKWAGGTGINTGTASNTDIMSFSLISLDGTSWRVLGQIANYG
jgi:hypothetical protein